MTNWADQSASAVRRTVALVVAPTTPGFDTTGVNLASRLTTGGTYVPALDDGVRHARTRAGPHQRVLIRPAGLVTPAAEYIGRGTRVVKL